MRRNLPVSDSRGSAAGRARSLRVLALCGVQALACTRAEEPPGTGSAPPTGAADTVATDSQTFASESPDATALRELSDRFVRGLLAGAPDTVASIYSVTAEVFAPGEPNLLLGQEAVRDHWARWLEDRAVERFDLRRSAPVVRADVAYSFGVWTAVLRPADGDPPLDVAGRITDVYRRDGAGPWVVSHEHASLSPSAPGSADLGAAAASPRPAGASDSSVGGGRH